MFNLSLIIFFEAANLLILCVILAVITGHEFSIPAATVKSLIEDAGKKQSGY